MKKSRASLVAFLQMLAVSCTPWPQSGYEKVEDLLARTADQRDCRISAWANSQDFEQPPLSSLKGVDLHLDPDEALWMQSNDSVMAVARSRHAGYLWEVAIVQWGPDHYYVRRGDWITYDCSIAASPVEKIVPPLGEMTDNGTALDGAFRPVERSKQ